MMNQLSRRLVEYFISGVARCEASIASVSCPLSFIHFIFSAIYIAAVIVGWRHTSLSPPLIHLVRTSSRFTPGLARLISCHLPTPISNSRRNRPPIAHPTGLRSPPSPGPSATAPPRPAWPHSALLRVKSNNNGAAVAFINPLITWLFFFPPFFAFFRLFFFYGCAACGRISFVIFFWHHGIYYWHGASLIHRGWSTFICLFLPENEIRFHGIITILL